jgi:hypothetical protein
MKKCDVSLLAAIAQIPNPIRLTRPRLGATLTAGYHPLNSFQVQQW